MKIHGIASSRPQLQWIYQLSKGERALYLLVTAMDCVSAVLYVLYAFLARNLIDGAVAGDKAAIVLNALYLLALVLLRIALNLASRRLTLGIRRKWEIKARTRVLDSLLHKNEGALKTYHSGALHDRLFADVNAVAETAVDLVPDFASMIAGLAAALLSLFWIERLLPLVIVVCGLLFVAVRRLFGGKIKAYYTAIRNQNAERSAYYQEILENLLILKVFRAETAARERGEYYEKKSYLAWRIGYRYRLLMSGGISAFFSLGELAAMVFASVLVMGAKLTYGSMTALLQLVAQVQAPFSDIFSEVSAFSAMVTSAERLMELEALPEEKESPARDARALYANMRQIRLSDVTFSYREGAPILRGANAVVGKGDFVLIAGESGIGKSTLLKILLNVLSPEGGSAYIECADGERVPLDNAARALFAYVPQGNMLFSGTIRDNLTFLCGNKEDAAIWRALEAACADQFVREKESGLDALLTEDGGGLSEGQAQRLAIARALLCDAPVLLFDEATSSLDSDTEAQILRHLRALPEKTLLIISHRDAARDICDVEWRIRDGRVEERRLRSN